MPKGQHSRVPRLGNSWMLFTFQAGLQVLQQLHKDPYSLQLAIHAEIGLHYIILVLF